MSRKKDPRLANAFAIKFYKNDLKDVARMSKSSKTPKSVVIRHALEFALQLGFRMPSNR